MPEPRTLVEALLAARAVPTRGFTFVPGHGDESFLSFADLADEALRVAARLARTGLRPGDRLALVLPEPREFVIAFFGAIAGGFVPVPMYPPLSLGKLDAYMESAARILGAAGARALLTSDQLAPLLWGLVGKADVRDLHTLTKLAAGPAADPAALPAVGPDDLCFLQFTSGSTSDPKGVMVTHANLLANTKASAVDGAALDPETDRLVSWLPLYHDMGLIGFVVTPVVMRVATWLIPTMSFVKQPNLWMETIDRIGGTVTFGPNFAFALAARRATDEHLARWKLDRLRLVGCGAEPIQAETLRLFTRTFARCGMPATAPLPAYGMAEATLAVAFKPRDQVFRTVTFDALHFCETA
ncbi:MAG: AMP-binding protein, partial [Myxococcota bacterium]